MVGKQLCSKGLENNGENGFKLLRCGCDCVMLYSLEFFHWVFFLVCFLTCLFEFQDLKHISRLDFCRQVENFILICSGDFKFGNYIDHVTFLLNVCIFVSQALLSLFDSTENKYGKVN